MKYRIAILGLAVLCLTPACALRAERALMVNPDGTVANNNSPSATTFTQAQAAAIADDVTALTTLQIALGGLSDWDFTGAVSFLSGNFTLYDSTGTYPLNVIFTGTAENTLEVSGDVTLDQNLETTAYPVFAGLTVGSFGIRPSSNLSGYLGTDTRIWDRLYINEIWGNVKLPTASYVDGESALNAAMGDVRYATVAQGSLADTATQPGDDVSTLTNDAGYIDGSSLNADNLSSGTVPNARLDADLQTLASNDGSDLAGVVAVASNATGASLRAWNKALYDVFAPTTGKEHASDAADPLRATSLFFFDSVGQTSIDALYQQVIEGNPYQAWQSPSDYARFTDNPTLPTDDSKHPGHFNGFMDKLGVRFVWDLSNGGSYYNKSGTGASSPRFTASVTGCAYGLLQDDWVAFGLPDPDKPAPAGLTDLLPIPSDEFQAVLEQNTGLGTGKIQYSTDGTSWTDAGAEIDLDGSAIAVCPNRMVTHGSYYWRIIGTDASNEFIVTGGWPLDSTIPEVNVIMSGQSSQQWANYVNLTPEASRRAILTAVDPDSIVIHYADGEDGKDQTGGSVSGGLYTTSLGLIHDDLAATVGECGVVVVSHIHQAGATPAVDATATRNAILDACVAHNYTPVLMTDWSETTETWNDGEPYASFDEVHGLSNFYWTVFDATLRPAGWYPSQFTFPLMAKRDSAGALSVKIPEAGFKFTDLDGNVTATINADGLDQWNVDPRSYVYLSNTAENGFCSAAHGQNIDLLGNVRVFSTRFQIPSDVTVANIGFFDGGSTVSTSGGWNFAAWTDGKIRFYAKNAANGTYWDVYWPSWANWADDNWHDLQLVCDFSSPGGETVDLYIDGALISKTSSSAKSGTYSNAAGMTNGSRFTVGMAASGGSTSKKYFDWLVVLNDTPTASELVALRKGPEALGKIATTKIEHAWNIDEGIGYFLLDSAGNMPLYYLAGRSATLPDWRGELQTQGRFVIPSYDLTGNSGGNLYWKRPGRAYGASEKAAVMPSNSKLNWAVGVNNHGSTAITNCRPQISDGTNHYYIGANVASLAAGGWNLFNAPEVTFGDEVYLRFVRSGETGGSDFAIYGEYYKVGN